MERFGQLPDPDAIDEMDPAWITQLVAYDELRQAEENVSLKR